MSDNFQNESADIEDGTMGFHPFVFRPRQTNKVEFEQKRGQKASISVAKTKPGAQLPPPQTGIEKKYAVTQQPAAKGRKEK